MNEKKTYPLNAYANLSLKDMVLKITEEFFEFGDRNNPPRQDLIVFRLSEIKKRLDKGNRYNYEYDSLQPQVSRKLKILLKEHKIAKIDKHCYVPFDINFKRRPIAERIKKEVIFTKPNIFKLSPYSILVPVDPRSLYISKILFKEYLEEDCFDVLELDGYVLILLPQKYSEDMESSDCNIVSLNISMGKERIYNIEICKIIRKLVEDCYYEQHKKTITKIKLVQHKPEK